MAFKVLLWHLFLFHVPYKKLHFLRPYLDFVRQLTLFQDERLRRIALLLYPIVMACFFNNAYLWYASPSLISSILHVDLAMIAFQTPIIYPCICGFSFQAVYFYKVLFMNMEVSFISLLENIFFRKRSKLIEGLTYGGLTPRQATQRMLQVVLTTLQFTILCLDTIDLFILMQLFIQTVTYADELFGSPVNNPLTFLWNILCMLINFTVTAISLTALAYTMHIGCIIGFSFLLIVNWRLKQSETILAVYEKKRQFYPLTAFNQYLKYSKVTFQTVFTTNNAMGSLMSIFFVVNMPISAFLLMKLALEEQSLTSTITLALLPTYQVPTCFLIHLVTAKMSKRLHAPSKVLLSLNAATAHRMGDFRARLRLHTAIVRLHSKVKYGFTYGTIGGRVTMGSFGKCMLLYGELLMYAYTFIRDI